MQRTLVRYRAKPEKIEENQRLIGEVFREPHARSSNDVRYLVLRLSDGTFRHLVEDSSKTIPSLEAFAAFRRGGEDRRMDERQLLEATVVGNYRMLDEPEAEVHGSCRKRHDRPCARQSGGARARAWCPPAEAASLWRAHGRLGDRGRRCGPGRAGQSH